MVDAADAEVSDGVMIAFLPTSSEWCRTDLPHMTLVYAGSKGDLKPTDFNDLAKDSASLASIASPFALRVVATEILGPDNDKVNALIFQPTPELWSMRRFVERWNKSEFPFKPHATIGPAQLLPDIVPTYVRFNRMILAWGEDYIPFSLTNGSSMDY